MLNNPIESLNASNNVSSLYNFVSTKEIVNYLDTKGWYVHSTNISRSRLHEGFQKHMLKLRNDNYIIGEDNVEITLINAHNAMSSIIIAVGINVRVCSNGCIFGEVFFSDRIRHAGFTYDRVDRALSNIVEIIPQIAAKITKMKMTVLNDVQVFNLASNAINFRLGEIENVNKIELQDVINPRHQEQSSDTLWNVFNRVQEAVIKGGVSYQTKHNKENNVIEFKNHTTRKVTAINKVYKLNVAIFEEALKYAA